MDFFAGFRSSRKRDSTLDEDILMIDVYIAPCTSVLILLSEKHQKNVFEIDKLRTDRMWNHEVSRMFLRTRSSGIEAEHLHQWGYFC